MFGDDPDPLVMTARVGSGRSFRTRLRRWSVAVQRGLNGRTTNEQLVSERSTKAKGGRGNYEQMQVLKTMTVTKADAMRMML